MEQVQTKPLSEQITPLVQRQEEEAEIQTKPLAEQITPLVQRQAEEEEEPIQAKLASTDAPIVQRQAEPEEEEETLQTKRSRGQTSQVTQAFSTNINSLKGGGSPLPVSVRSFFEPRFGNDFSQVRVHKGSQAAETARAVQAKEISSNSSYFYSSLGSRIHSLRGNGRPLSKSIRNYFEPRFGYDFGRVRLHTDGNAAQAAQELNAHAFVVGKNIVFGSGKHSPHTKEGKRLLAHELTHVVQQGASSQRIQRFVACSTDCPSRESGEADRARRDSLQVSPMPAPDVGILISGFDIGSHDVSTLATAPGFATFWGSLVTGSNSYEIIGFTDCHGIARNTLLRWRRAMNVNNGLPSAARTNITRFAAAPLSDCIASNATVEGRRQNRSVAIRLVTTSFTFPSEPVPGGIPCPPTRTSGATRLEEYIPYILCAETTTGYSPRNMLAMLRQMYYGKSWSATSTTNKWDNVIPCSPSLGNPSSRLGTNLFNALYNSAVVNGVDVGHVFAGLEAMTCPLTSVPFYVGLVSVAVPNEEFATFTGDLGAAVAAHLGCNELGAAAVHEEDCGFRAAPQNLAFYFHKHAPDEDLEGDIDPFAIRAGELGIPCAGSLGRRLTITRPVSDIFHEYYNAPSSTLGAARPNRYLCVLNALGAIISGNRITNKPAIAPPLEGRVYEFARAFYHKIRGTLIHPGAGGLIRMWLDSERVVNWFLTYLANQL